MINAQAGYGSSVNEFKQKCMRAPKNALVLHSNGGQLVDVEESSVVDFFGLNTPKGQSIRLVIDDLLQKIKGLGPADFAGKMGQVRVDKGRYGGADLVQRGQPAFGDFLLASAF